MLEYFPSHPAVVQPGQIKLLTPTTPVEITFGFLPIVLKEFSIPTDFIIQFYPLRAIALRRGSSGSFYIIFFNSFSASSYYSPSGFICEILPFLRITGLKYSQFCLFANCDTSGNA